MSQPQKKGRRSEVNQIKIGCRRFITSRIEHFKQQTLAQLLAEAQADYLHLGDKLGGYRRFITSELEKRGWQIGHIIDEKQTWPPAKLG